MNLPCLFNQGYTQVACALGQPFNIYRPPYASVQDQAPTLIGTTPLLVKPGGEKFAIPRINGVNYFNVTGNRGLFKPGDVLQPVDPNSSIPTITVLNYEDGQPCIAFRTSRICSVTLDLDTLVYENIYYDYISLTVATHGLVTDLSGALDIAHKKIAMYSRTLILPQFNEYEISGMRVIETDGTVPVRYTIQGITVIGHLVVFTVDQEVT